MSSEQSNTSDGYSTDDEEAPQDAPLSTKRNFLFYEISPLMQWIVGDSSHEYHIHTYLDDDYREAFFDNCGKHFYKVIHNFVMDNFGEKIKGDGFDEKYGVEGCDRYIWIHLDKNGAEQTIKDIIEKLQDKYDEEWYKYKIPKLLTIIKNSLLKDVKSMAHAVSHYQNLHSFDKTQGTLHVLFRDVAYRKNRY